MIQSIVEAPRQFHHDLSSLMTLNVLEERSTQDLLPEEHRHLSGDVFRDGVLLAVGVRVRQSSWTTSIDVHREYKDSWTCAEKPHGQVLAEVCWYKRNCTAD